MAGLADIPSGTKLQLSITNDPSGEPVFDMLSTFASIIDESAFTISMPLRDGKPFQPDESSKVLLKYNMGSEVMVIAAYCDDVVKKGIRNYLKMRRVSEQRQFFQRKDERYKLAIPVRYMQPTWPLNADGRIVPEEAMTIDISAGGMAVFISQMFEVGESLHLSLPRIGTDEAGQGINDLVSVVCWYREAPKGSPRRLMCGLQFRFADESEHKVLADYVGNIKNVYKLKA